MQSPDMPTMTGRPVRPIKARNASHSTTEPIHKLNHFFDKCCDQFRHLEKERRKVIEFDSMVALNLICLYLQIESELALSFAGQKISSANNIPIQRLPPNATKVDRIITDMFREHAKVVTIVGKMEQLKGGELSEAIHNAIQKWYDLIRLLQMKRKYEVQRSAAQPMAVSLPDEPLIEQMSDIMKSLTSAIRSVRTFLWCSLMVTLYDQTLPSVYRKF